MRETETEIFAPECDIISAVDGLIESVKQPALKHSYGKYTKKSFHQDQNISEWLSLFVALLVVNS